MLSVFGKKIRKKHIAAVSVLILAASGSATVDIKDTTNIFGNINMHQNNINSLQDPQNPQDAATKNYVDNNGGVGSVDVIEEDGPLGTYKYCSISRIKDTASSSIRDSTCTVSRSSDGMWTKSSSGGSCHASCFGLDTQTETVTVSAKGLSGGADQNISLGQEYPDVLRVEWTGDGIQPENETESYVGPYLAWRLSVRNSQTSETHRIMETGLIDPAPAAPRFFATGEQRDNVDYGSYSENPVGLFRESYVSRVPQVTIDSVRLNAGYEPGDYTEGVYWSGSEQIKITYIPDN